MMTAVVAVALGVAPVKDGDVVRVSAEMARKVGHYSVSTDRRGTSRVYGLDSSGRPYELILDRNGQVEASVGERMIYFHVAETP